MLTQSLCSMYSYRRMLGHNHQHDHGDENDEHDGHYAAGSSDL